jgi:predicted amidohydrolase
MMLRLAVVQPRTFRGKESERNVEEAARYIAQAAEAQAQVICFPEGYPGPSNPAHTYSSLEAVQDKAQQHGVYVVASQIEPAHTGEGYYMALRLIGPDGHACGTYRRTTPMGPYIYRDIPDWQFTYIASDALPIFPTPFGSVGLLICSEVYAPELSRLLALKGAEVVLIPAGALINELLPTWRIMVWARAIENLMYTATCQNIFGVEDGVAMVAGPECILAQRVTPGILTADLDMDRIRWLRGQDEKIEMPKQYRVVPGIVRWHRPDLYRKNYPDW